MMKKFLLLPMLLFCADQKTIPNPILTEPICKFDLMQHEIERLSSTIKTLNKEKDLLELKFKTELETEKSKQEQNDLKMRSDLRRQMEMNQELTNQSDKLINQSYKNHNEFMSVIERYNKVTNMQSQTIDSLSAKNTSLRRANRVLLPACLLLAVYSTYITLTK
jgi:DNA/RNA endonuclease G (NUC1)